MKRPIHESHETTRKMRISILLLITHLACASFFGQTTKNSNPTASGEDAHWPTAAKTGFGTSNSLASKVWFTLADGVMTEVFYPRLDVPNTQCLELIVCTKQGCQSEQEDMVHQVRPFNPRALSFQQVNSPKRGGYTINKTYTTDPERSTVLIRILINGLAGQDDRVYVFFDPSLNNSGMHDTAWTSVDALLASDGDVASALISSVGFSELTNGYRGSRDASQQLRNHGRIVESSERVVEGNVIQLGKVRRHNDFTLALGFGKDASQALSGAKASLRKGFPRITREYEAGWSKYLKSLRSVEARYTRQFNMAAMVLKAFEDKTFRGAMIASPSSPWGGGPNANEPVVSGYHAVWARDLYHVATAFIAMEDTAAADRALNYLFGVQQKADGSFPQNSWVDGRPIGGGLQMDQVALPLVLAYQLGRTDRETWLRHIKPAADFIVRNGPTTAQDRWEEKPGYSPATIAAEIAALVCAARIGEINEDQSASASYLKTADSWAERVEGWTATSNGTYGDGHYYLRITEKGNPNDPAMIEINSGGGRYEQREIVDAGFLELVRLGVKSASDPLIAKSVAVIDQLIKVSTPAGPSWYRYNHDAYGERPDGKAYDGRTGKGRLWTLLAGERAEFELARGNGVEARKLLNTLCNFANEGFMIPEQVWDQAGEPSVKPGSGTGSATPLAWSMAQFIRLVFSVSQNRNIETPDIVAKRYSKQVKNVK